MKELEGQRRWEISRRKCRKVGLSSTGMYYEKKKKNNCAGKRVMVMEVPGKRRRGRPKQRRLDNIKNDLSERELSAEEAQDRIKWRCLIRNIDPT